MSRIYGQCYLDVMSENKKRREYKFICLGKRRLGSERSWGMDEKSESTLHKILKEQKFGGSSKSKKHFK